MPSFFRRLLDRAAEKANRSAAGTAVPAGLEPTKPGERPKPTARERTVMRRRLRALRKRRESLASAGGVRDRELGEIDAEMGLLTAALAERTTLDELLAGGTLARCPDCGELVAKRERQCANCGAQLPHGRESGPHAVSRAARTAVPVTTAASSGRSRTPPAR